MEILDSPLKFFSLTVLFLELGYQSTLGLWGVRKNFLWATTFSPYT